MNVRNYRVYIEDQEALEAFVERARRSSVLAIDTEFLREKTYYARLCLIQFATDDEVAVVDPFCIEDLHVLAPLLEDASVMKVLHSGGQDLEILWHEVGVLPQPLFDTQVAAALLGHTQQIGYGALVGAECGVALTLANLGGLESDSDCHVYNTERAVISGLYVAGAPQGGRFNVQYPISLKGLSAGMCMVFGKIAGENAAAGK